MTHHMSRLRMLVLAVAMLLSAALVIGVAAPVAADAAPQKKNQAKKPAKKKNKKKKVKKPRWPMKAPAGLKFYKPPKKMPTAHGKLIWQRKVGGMAGLKNASSSRLVLYTSKTTSGKVVPVSGLVSFPKGKAPKGGWPLITWGHSTTGIADKCAPSRIKRNGPVQEGITYINQVLNGWLKAGYAVARSDFRGLGTPGVHPYIHGISAGRDMLDIARAARLIGPKVSKRYLIGGHSQGGHAALFAAGLASKWTPELKLRGSAIYAPGSQYKLQAQSLALPGLPDSLTALATMLFRGLSTVYPSLKPGQLLTDPVLKFYPDTDKECLDRLAQPDNLGGISPKDLIRPDADRTELYRILDLQNPAVKSERPILLLQGTKDEATPPLLTAMLNNQLNELGNRVDYRTYEGLDHWVIVDDAQPDVLEFFRKQLPAGR